MKPLEKQKMCPNCEGRVPLEAEICPYCAHEIGAQAAKPQSPLFQSQTLEDSLASLYKPPYQSKPVEEAPMPRTLPPKSLEASLYGHQEEEQAEPQKAKKSSLLPTILLMLASQLFILGFLQLFFATDGIVRLEWDASNWFFYCLLAAPLFYFGWKKLQEIE